MPGSGSSNVVVYLLGVKKSTDEVLIVGDKPQDNDNEYTNGKQRYLCCWQRVCGVCPLGEVSCRRMGAVVMIFEVSICWCSTAVTAVGCSDALGPGGSRGVVFLPLWAVLVGYHSLSAEGVSVRWGSPKG